MNHFKYLLFALLCWFSCEDKNELITRESCDYTICEEGRNNADTILNGYGILRSAENLSFIEQISGAPYPDTFYISCLNPDILLPDVNSYVIFSGYTREVCDPEAMMMQKDSLFLTEIAKLSPEILYSCDMQIDNSGIDNKMIDDKLKILNLSIEKNCISMLISYTGGCDQQPDFTLHSGDLLFGGGTFIMSVQGLINEDCDEETMKVLKYDLSSLGEIVPIRESEYFTLFFQSQGYYRVHYEHTYN